MYEITTLPNGVRIAYEHMDAVRSAALGIWVGVGSRYEKKGEEGSAHFIEHMLFKGTKDCSAAALAERMDSLGGQFNAFTTRESTCFYARALDTHLPEVTDILCGMFFDSLFSEEDVMSERGVVLEEIDMYRDTPEDLVVEQQMAKIFPGPLGRPVLGRPSTLLQMTGEGLRAFMEREYNPDRIVISLCGSFTDADLQRLSDRFSLIPAVRSKKLRKTAFNAVDVFKRKATEQNHFCLAWPGLPEGDPSRFACQIMSMILGGGMSSRLFQKVWEEHGMCYTISSFSSSYADTGMFGVSTAVGRETEKEALSLIRQEVGRFVADGISAQELDRARELIKSSIILSMESTSARMNRLGSSVLYLGGCLTDDEIIERYNAVTADEVNALAGRILDPRGLSISAVGRLSEPEKYSDLLR